LRMGLAGGGEGISTDPGAESGRRASAPALRSLSHRHAPPCRFDPRDATRPGARSPLAPAHHRGGVDVLLRPPVSGSHPAGPEGFGNGEGFPVRASIAWGVVLASGPVRGSPAIGLAGAVQSKRKPPRQRNL